MAQQLLRAPWAAMAVLVALEQAELLVKWIQAVGMVAKVHLAQVASKHLALQAYLVRQAERSQAAGMAAKVALALAASLIQAKIPMASMVSAELPPPTPLLADFRRG